MNKILSLLLLLSMIGCSKGPVCVKEEIDPIDKLLKKKCELNEIVVQIQFMCFPEKAYYAISPNNNRAKYHCGENSEIKELKRQGSGKCAK